VRLFPLALAAVALLTAPAVGHAQLPSPDDGRLVISWEAPTRNTDGTPICPVTKYRVQANPAADFTAAGLQWEVAAPNLAVIVTVGPGPWHWRAQAECQPGQTSAWTSPAVRTEQQWLTLANPTEWPKPFGTGSWFQARRNDAGFAIYWQCRAPSGLRHCGFVGRWSELEGDWGRQLAQAAALGDEGLAMLWQNKILPPPPGGDPWAAVRPLYDELRNANALSLAAPVYRVKLNAGLATRAANRIANGVVTSQVVGRVSVNGACDCSAFKQGEWCSVAGLENMATAAPDRLINAAALCAVQ
jgi:hypothetical protein